MMPIYSSSHEEKLHFLFNKDVFLRGNLSVIILLKSISLIVYGYVIYKVYKKSLIHDRKIDAEVVKWKLNIFRLNSIYVVSYIFYGLALVNLTPEIFRYPQIMIMCVIVLYVAYTAYVQPSVFSRKYLFADELHKYQKSGLTKSLSYELKDQLLYLLKEEKVFKLNNISLDMLSERLGTTRHNLSQVINEHFDVNFFKLINRFRILEAKQILKTDAHQNLHIIDVAYDVGFNNKVTFNKAFKVETNLTPTQFLQNVNSDRRLVTSA